MNDLETQIAAWRTYVAKSPAINGHDVDELESHLRDQIADLDAVGLDTDEAFLVAVKRMGGIDSISREFAREHSARLWKQLVLSGDDERPEAASGWVAAVAFAFGRSRRHPSRPLDRRIPGRPAGMVRTQPQPVRAAVPGGVLRLPAPARYAAPGCSPRCPSSYQRFSSTCTRSASTPTPRCSSPSTCRSCCGSSSPIRTWAARSTPMSDAWTSCASPGSGSSTTC